MAAATTTTTTTETAMAATEGKIPNWRVTGDWFDVCKCNIPCPCEFAQTPTYGDCEGILAYNVKIGNYGKTSLDGLNVLAVGSFKGNIWAGDGTTKVDLALFFDERANEQQREALNMIFSGKAGGFMAEFASLSEKFEELNTLLSSLSWQRIYPIGVQRYPEKFLQRLKH